MDFFLISKILRPLLTPLHALCAMTLLGVLLTWCRSIFWHGVGRILALMGIMLILLIGFLPIGEYWLHQTETEVPRVTLPAQVDGIIVLGGIIQGNIYKASGEPVISEHPDRVRAFLMLSRQYPQAKLLFTGGSSRLLGQTVSEADIFPKLWAEIGGDAKRLMVERQSRNTIENVGFSQKLVQPKPGENWILVTSAYHMPRAYGEFLRAGWHVLPYPCDYYTANGVWDNYRAIMTVNWDKFNHAFQEWIGGIAYQLRNKE